MITNKGQYWRQYFAERHRLMCSAGAARSLDYPNDALRLQIYAHLFEAAGALEGKDCLDVGCGWGACALMYRGCGANVTGIDIVPETIDRLTCLYPDVTWRVMDATSTDLSQLPTYDRILASEVLQHVDFAQAVRALWAHLRPGGRLLGSIPNAECPIIRTVVERYDGYFAGASASQIERVCASLCDFENFWLKGLSFRVDQTFLPYNASVWGKTVTGRPNRLIFALLRSERNRTCGTNA